MTGATTRRATWAGLLAVLAICVAFLTPPPAANAATAAPHAAVASAARAILAGRALDWAEANAAGHTYLYGAAGPGSYDCSGLVMAAYAREGIALPHNTVAMLRSGKLTAVPVASAPRGALLFFGTGHVEFKTIWPDTSFGAHSSHDPIIGWRQWSGYYHPTAAYVVGLTGAQSGHNPRRPWRTVAYSGRSDTATRTGGPAYARIPH